MDSKRSPSDVPETIVGKVTNPTGLAFIFTPYGKSENEGASHRYLRGSLSSEQTKKFADACQSKAFLLIHAASPEALQSTTAIDILPPVIGRVDEDDHQFSFYSVNHKNPKDVHGLYHYNKDTHHNKDTESKVLNRVQIEAFANAQRRGEFLCMNVLSPDLLDNETHVFTTASLHHNVHSDRVLNVSEEPLALQGEREKRKLPGTSLEGESERSALNQGDASQTQENDKREDPRKKQRREIGTHELDFIKGNDVQPSRLRPRTGRER